MSDYVKGLKDSIDSVTGTTSTWSGLCLWVGDVPKESEHAPALLGLGCKWSQKRQQWYLRIEEA